MNKEKHIVPLCVLLKERKKHRLTKQKLKTLQPKYIPDETIKDIVEYIRKLTFLI